MKKTILMMCAALFSVAVEAQNDVVMTKNGLSTTLDNGLIKAVIGTDGRIKNMTYKGGGNLMGSNGIYFDYTADKNRALSPSKAEIIKQTPDMCEVLYSNTSGDLRFQQGFIMRKGESGLYVYVIANGTTTSSTVKLKETRVCVRLASSFLNGYVDDSMNGKIPSNSEMATAEKSENTVQDATYRMSDGSIYTKYNWANYCVRDSLHGLMNAKNGVWNIPCSYEWMNGGPLKQELTVHATSKSPITIQMLQGEHLGASAQYYEDGERKIYGPFFIYVNSGTQEEMIADAKKKAHEMREAWPFGWFENELYPLDRSTVQGRLNITTGLPCDSIRLILAEPGTDPYLQGKGYIYWGDTDKEGNFVINNVRKGKYTLYGYAMKGEITDELQKTDIVVDGEITDLGNVEWAPVRYANKLWQIGDNNRMSDGFCMSDAPRAYGLWEDVPANLNFVIGESNPAKDWYYAQTKNGTWTVTFNLDDTYTGTAWLTASAAGATNKPKVSVAVNGTNSKTWSFGTNDAAIYRSAVLGGRHWLQTHSFPASALKKGKNTITFTMSGISKNGGVMWDCIKLESGTKVVPSGIENISDDNTGKRIDVFTLSGVKVGSFDSLSGTGLDKGIYIIRQNGMSQKTVIK